jgi:hypothetical protein
MITKKTAKNQVTLPKAIVERIPKTEFFDVHVRDGEIVLRPVQTASRTVTRIREKMKRLEITEKDINAAIRWARQR